MEISGSNSPEAEELLGMVEEIAACVEYVAANYVPHLDGERFLDSRQVCCLLKIKERTLQEYRRKGLIGYYKLEGKVLHKQSDIEKMLRDNYVPAIG